MKKKQEVNETARIQNVELLDTINGVVQNCTRQVFERVINLDNLKNITTDFANMMINELKAKSFMTLDLELSDTQREFMLKELPILMNGTATSYQNKMNKEERTKEVIAIIEDELKKIIEETLRNIAKEINRGAIINSVAVSADTKNDKYNKIELNHSKHSGDVTIPTKGVFISTNCIDVILNSIKVEEPEEVKK